MASVFPLVLHVEFGDGHMFQPIAFLAFRAMHGRIARRGGIGPMKMGKAGLPMIRLRFGTKPAFDALADPLQDGRGIAHGLIEHQELDPALAFVQPQMVGRVRVDRLKRVGFEEDRPDVGGGFWRGSRAFAGLTAADPDAAEHPPTMTLMTQSFKLIAHLHTKVVGIDL